MTRKNDFKLLTWVILVSTFIAVVFWPTQVRAQESNHVAVLFVLDDSGSMGENDPHDLRYTAAKLFIAALDEGDMVGAIRFSTSSQPLTDGFVLISDEHTKNELIQSFQATEADGYTNVKGAYQTVAEMLLSSDLTGYKTIIVFLTDGKPEIENPYAAYEGETLEVIESLQVPIYAIALTPAGRSAFLSKVTDLTSGKVIPAQDANDILDSYLQILGDLKDRSILGSGSVASPSTETIYLDPALMPYVSKVTFIISKDAAVRAVLINPDGGRITASNPDVKFFMDADPGFQVVTIDQPPSSTWSYQLSGNGQAQIRAILHSRLRVKIIAPTGLQEAGQPILISLNLVEEQANGKVVKIVGDAYFSTLITLPDGSQESLDQFYDDGTHGDELANDGNFSRVFVNTGMSGSYQISVSGYKGIVPLSTTTIVQMIELPELIINQPNQSLYEIRQNSVPLQIALLGDDLALFEGEIEAQITSPSGMVGTIPLGREHSSFSGEFIPSEDGLYTINYIPVEATYQGIVFTKQLVTTIESHIIPEVVIRNIVFGSNPPGKTGQFEIQHAKQGIPIQISMASNASREIPIQIRLENMPGFSLEIIDPLLIPANDVITVTATLTGNDALQIGDWHGELVFSAHENIDMVNPRQSLFFEIFQPTMQISSQLFAEQAENACSEWFAPYLLISTTSTSHLTETLSLSLYALDGFDLAQKTISVPSGFTQTKVELVPSTDPKVGTYQGTIDFEAAHAGLEIQSPANQAITFTVPPIWMRCRKPLILLGLGGLLASILVARTIRKIRKKAEPPKVTGTLVHWHQQTPDQIMNANLTELNKTEVKIGRNSSCDVVFPEVMVADEHIVIVAESGEEGETRLTLHPLHKVQKGYRDYTSVIPLEENTTYQIGERFFKYIADLSF